jgi:hypothetical protein
MELLVRVSQIIGSLSSADSPKSLEDHIESILGNCFLPLGRKWWDDIEEYHEICFTERIDGIFKVSLESLRHVFTFYAGQHQHRAADKNTPMVVSEWMELLKEFQLLDKHFDKKMAPWAFTVGRALVPDEATTLKHMEINFVEFLIALGYVIYLRAAKIENVDSFPEVLEEVLDEPLSELHNKVLQWEGSPIVSSKSGKVRGFNVSPDWMVKVGKFLQELFKASDDDLDGELSVREFRASLALPHVQQKLVEFGIFSLDHSEIFQQMDMDGSGDVSVIEALNGLAMMKERHLHDEKTFHFFRHIFTHHSNPHDLFHHHEVKAEEVRISRDEFLDVLSSDEVVKRMRGLGMFFSPEDFWDFLSEDRDADVSLDAVLQGYLKFRDPMSGGDKAVVFLRTLFEEADVDCNGYLSKAEYTKVFSIPKNIEKLAKLGILGACHDFENEQDMEDYLVLFFHEIDQNFDVNLTVQELVTGFVAMRNEMRMRTLEDITHLPASKRRSSMREQAKASRRTSRLAKSDKAKTRCDIGSPRSPTSPISRSTTSMV